MAHDTPLQADAVQNQPRGKQEQRHTEGARRDNRKHRVRWGERGSDAYRREDGSANQKRFTCSVDFRATVVLFKDVAAL